MLEGFDGSNWTGAANMAGMVRAGKQFMIWKAYQGMHAPDPTFPAAWHAAHTAGLIRGAYHFFADGWDGSAQAHALHSYVHAHGGMHGHDFVALDLEWPVPADIPAYLREAESFVNYVVHAWHRQCVIYTSSGYWAELGNPQLPTLAHCPLWSADWGVLEPQPFGPWGVVSIWQYRGSTHDPNATGPIDLDRFNGTRVQLLAVTKPRE